MIFYQIWLCTDTPYGTIKRKVFKTWFFPIAILVCLSYRLIAWIDNDGVYVELYKYKINLK